MSLEYILRFLTLFFCCFPWLSFSLNSMDTQPHFILFSFLYVFLWGLRRSYPIWVYFLGLNFLVYLFVGVAWGVIDGLFFRGVFTALSIFSVSLFTYLLVSKNMLPGSFFVFVNIVWVVVALLQYLYGKDVFSYLVSVRTTANRGVTSLAPEPTFFAIYLLFISLCIYAVYRRKNILVFWFIYLLNFMATVFLAKSSMGLLLFIIPLFVYLFSRLIYFVNFRSIVLCLLFLLVLVTQIGRLGGYFEGSRLLKIASIFLESPARVVYVDASVNERVKHVFYPLYYQVQHGFFPFGFHAFGDASFEMDQKFGRFFWWGNDEDKIMSGFGSVVFEVGVLSLAFFLALGYLFFVGVKRGVAWALISIYILMWAAVPLAFSLFMMSVIMLCYNERAECFRSDLKN